MVNLVTATEHSINTAYVNLGQDVGNEKIAKMAEKMGIPASQMNEKQRAAATFPLGIVSLRPVQQAGVYATFADEGVHRTPFVVKSVTDNENEKRTFTEKGNRALSAQNARDATYAMQKVVQGGTGTNAQLPDGRDVAGKTGTTDEGKAIWFNGYIPQMATSVAMFRSDNKPLNIPGYGAYGGQLPAQIWRTYMADAVNIKDYAPKSFGSPSQRPGGGVERPTGPSTPGDTQPPAPPARPSRRRPRRNRTSRRPRPACRPSSSPRTAEAAATTAAAETPAEAVTTAAVAVAATTAAEPATAAAAQAQTANPPTPPAPPPTPDAYSHRRSGHTGDPVTSGVWPYRDPVTPGFSGGSGVRLRRFFGRGRGLVAGLADFRRGLLHHGVELGDVAGADGGARRGACPPPL